MKKSVTLAITVSCAALLAVAALDRDPPVAAEPEGTAVSPDVPARPTVRRFAPMPRGQRARYSLAYEARVVVGEAALEPTRVGGTWTLQRQGDRVQARLVDANVSGQGALPPAEAADQPFQARIDRGAIDAVAFEPGTPLEVENLLTTLLTTVWMSEGYGDRWVVEEPDPNGLLEARYALRADGAVVRERSYVALRRGQTVERGESVASTGSTVFHVDEAGLVSARVSEVHRLGLEGASVVEVRVEASLQRIDVAAAPRFALLPLGAIRAHAVEGGTARDADLSLLDGDGPDAVLAEVRGVDRYTRGSQIEHKARGRAMRKVRALARTNDAHVARLRDALKDSADDPSEASMLAGGLAAAGTAEANAALVDAVGAMDASVSKANAVMALGTSDAADAESAAALTELLEDDEMSKVAALALGNQARTLATTDTEAADAAVRSLLDGYEGSETTDDAVAYLAALGNVGDPRALPLIQAALAGNDMRLAEVATWSLRFIDDPLADQLLSALVLGNGFEPRLALSAVRAVDFRSPDVWRTTLESALAVYPQGVIHNAILTVLARWSGQLPPSPRN